MGGLIKKLVKDESGQDLVEYGIALLMIAAGAGILATVVASNVNSLWSVANAAITAAA